MLDEEEQNRFKVVLIGESGVGKTCIINRFVKDIYEGNEVPTSSASLSSKEITIEEYGKTVRFEIWDTAGQEQYRSVGKIFYKNATAVILVYEITNKKSFLEIKNYWSKQIREHAANDINKFYFI